MNIARNYFLIFGVITAVLLASCVRPTPRTENPDVEQPQNTAEQIPTPVPVEETQPDPNVEQPATGTDDGATDEQPPAEGNTETGDPATETPTDGTDDGAATDEPTDENTDEANAGEGDEANNSGEGESTDDSPEEETSPPIPVTEHIVQAGENLYRIGLKYGKSYVQIAQANNIPAPYRIAVGQKLVIPGSEDTAPTVEGETTYIVKPGDTLYSIGLAKGISWIQIAEANGLSNPNRIAAGDTLKIPVSTPGPTPQFTHTVRAGETLYAIAIQYGVSWTAIAAENNISSPYVIFAGSTLSIPGN